VLNGDVDGLQVMQWYLKQVLDSRTSWTVASLVRPHASHMRCYSSRIQSISSGGQEEVVKIQFLFALSFDVKRNATYSMHHARFLPGSSKHINRCNPWTAI
jgi:hypothetical protein